MRVFELTAIDEGRPTVLLLNGGGQQPYNKFHKATRLFKPYDCNIISLELPGHGKSSFDHIVSTREMVANFCQELEDVCAPFDHVGLFGFSLGGLLSLKAAERGVRLFDFVIVSGAAMTIDVNQEQVMQEYTTVEFFEKMRWSKLMKNYHEDWQNLMKSISSMLHVDSNLFVAPSKLPDIPIHLVMGDSDEVADYSLHQPIADDLEQVSLHVLNNTSHFDYFTRSWDKMQKTMREIVLMYLEAED